MIDRPDITLNVFEICNYKCNILFSRFGIPDQYSSHFLHVIFKHFEESVSLVCSFINFSTLQNLILTFACNSLLISSIVKGQNLCTTWIMKLVHENELYFFFFQSPLQRKNTCCLVVPRCCSLARLTASYTRRDSLSATATKP